MKISLVRFLPLTSLVSLAFSSSMPSASADETFKTRISVDRGSLQCTDLSDYKTIECNLSLYGNDPIRTQLPILDKVRGMAARDSVRSPLAKVVNGLIAEAENSGGTLPVEIAFVSKIDENHTPYIEVNVRFTSVPQLIFSERYYNRPTQPPAPSCADDCCNSWCGTGQV